MSSESEIAIIVVCGARGGRCGRRLGIAKINSFGDKPVMYLSNKGWVTNNGYPLLEASVPPDFSGSTGIFACPDHGYLIIERSNDPPLAPGMPRGKWAHGISVQFPFFLLRDHHTEHLRTGRTQTIKWVPEPSKTIYAGRHT
jgi:hypothetical protein